LLFFSSSFVDIHPWRGSLCCNFASLVIPFISRVGLWGPSRLDPDLRICWHDFFTPV